MCLHIELDTKVKIANKDIVCYKVVEKIKNYKTTSSDYLFTPYRKMEVKIGEEYETYLRSYYLEVNEGFHSFVSLKDAIAEKKYWKYWVTHEYEIVKCIIPKGAEYYKGRFTMDIGSYDEVYYADSYASNKIKYVCHEKEE